MYRSVSGIQPTGKLHLGNYFGAMKQNLELQDSAHAFLFIADYHALTSLQSPSELAELRFEAAATYMAFGLAPSTLLFYQSAVPEVHELAWLLACVTGMGTLQRAHSYKDKVAQGVSPGMGLFSYPLLMAADILIYKGTIVPVGKDQHQHLQIAQEVATHFNQKFGEHLKLPEAKFGPSPIVPGTDGRKMSKSYGNTIPIFAEGKELRGIIAQIKTDSTPFGNPLPMETCPVFALISLLCSEAEKREIFEFYRTGSQGGKPFGYGHAKAILATMMEEHFAKPRQEYKRLLQDKTVVQSLLESHGEVARSVARETIEECRKACGFC